MKCERCKKNDATVHLTEIIKNVRSEVHICEKCSRDIGFNINNSDDLLNKGLSVDLFTSSIGKSCTFCGLHIEDFFETGLIGCPHCYDIFNAEIRSLTGNHHHSEGRPDNDTSDNINTETVDLIKDSQILTSDFLRIKLEKAVKEERYEDAAIIRDVIFSREGACRIKE
jgi:protein arginine kinase activator